MALLTTRGCEIGEGVRWHRRYNRRIKTSVVAAETASESTTKAATAAKATTATEAATWEAAETTAAETWATTSEAILTNLQRSALPFVTVELLDSTTSVVRRLVSDDTRSLGAAAWIGVDIGTDDGTLLG